MNNRFAGKTLQDAKRFYHELMKANHPDVGGDTEEAKRINEEYEEFCAGVMGDAMSGDERAEGYKASVFGDVLAKVSRLNCRIEIIGFWIYAFDSYGARGELADLGFWFSSSHKAWVYSGGHKVHIRSRYSIDQLRTMKGSELVKEEETLNAVGV